jgi:hypothetical protein
MFLKSKATGLPIYQCYLPQLVVLTADVPDYDEKVIREGFEYWNRVLGTTAFIYAGYIDSTSAEIDYANYVVVRVQKDEDATDPNDRGYARPILGKEGCIKGEMIDYIPTRINRNYNFLEWLVMHESGHTLGLDHSLLEGNLMYKTAPVDVVFVPRASGEQIQALKNIYNLE